MNRRAFTVFIWLAWVSGCNGVTTELEGTWIGHEVGVDSVEWRMVVRGNRFECAGHDGEVWSKGTFFLNEASTPKQIDVYIDDASDRKSEGKTALGIYQLVGTTLRLASCEPGITTRPSSFEGGQEGVKTFICNKR